MKTIKVKSNVFLMLFVLFAGEQVQAQFAGDVFFNNPSIAIAEGGKIQVEIQAFMGTSPFGAVQLDIVFDPTQLNIITVKPGSNEKLQNGFTFHEKDGVLSIIALNSESETVPIGTVSLVLIEVAPLTPAGSVINVSTQVRTLLRQDSSAFSSSNGVGLEIAVTNPNPANTLENTLSTVSSVTVVDSNNELYNRAFALRPEGAVVTLMILDENNNVSTTQISTTNPEIPSE